MITAVQAAMSGMMVQQRRTEVAANNVANVNTDGFKKSRVTSEDIPTTGGTRVTAIERLDTPGPLALEQTATGEQLVEKSNVDLVEDLTTTMMSRRYYEANAKIIKASDEMLGALLDVKG